MRVKEYHELLLKEVDQNEWFVLQILSNEEDFYGQPSMQDAGEWQSRAICHVKSVESGKMLVEGYELVNLIKHFDTDAPVPGGDELVEKMENAFTRGSLNHELIFGQLGIDLFNLTVINKLDRDWKNLIEGDYFWDSPKWRAIRLKGMYSYSDSINYHTIQ